MLQKANSVPFSVKALPEDDAGEGVFECHAAAFGNIDRVGDIIIAGAFKNTLATFLEDGVILWQHDQNEPIGRPLAAYEDAKGLYVKGQLSLNTARGRECYELMKDGVIRKFSIGYNVKTREWLYADNIEQYAPEGASATDIALALAYGAALIDIELFEISPVSIPANADTSLDSIKSAKASALDAAKAAKDAANAQADTQDEDALAASSALAIKSRLLKSRARMRKLVA